MNINNEVYRMLIQLKNSSMLKHLYCDITVISMKKIILILLKIFYERGFITNYIYLTNKKIRIFFSYYNNYSIFQKLKIFNKNYTRKDLYTLYYNTKSLGSINLYLFKTPFGFFFLDEIVLKKKFYIKLLLVCKF